MNIAQAGAAHQPARKALFLDRDGVINHNYGYVSRIEDFHFIPGIFELCQAASSAGYAIIIVTNQSGIARNYYSKQDFFTLMRWVKHQFWLNHVDITRTYFCPHHPDMTGPFGCACTCRKPKAGMLYRAQKEFGLNLRESLLVGDSLSDMRCANLAGIGKPVLLTTRAKPFLPKLEASAKKPYYRASELSAILPLI